MTLGIAMTTVEVIVDRRTGELKGIKAEGLDEAQADMLFKLLRQKVGQPAEVKTVTEYHANGVVVRVGG